MLICSTPGLLSRPFSPLGLKPDGTHFHPEYSTMIQEINSPSKIALIQDQEGSLALTVVDNGIEVDDDDRLLIVFLSQPTKNEASATHVLMAMKKRSPPILGLVDFLNNMIHRKERRNDILIGNEKAGHLERLILCLQQEHSERYKK